jgi:RNA polymerase sigma-70 factor (ECF subfamily)
VERHATSACVQRCLDFLPDNYRGVLLLHKAHGLSAAEIADLLQVSVGSVKIRLHRARKRLEKVMQAGCRVSETGQGIPCCAPKPGDISRLRSALAGDVRAGRRM